LRELTYVKTHRVEWRSVAEPRLRGPGEALVRPVIAARCDGDNLPIFNRVTNALTAGIALHCVDSVTSDLLGPRPYGKPFAVGHECVAEIVQCGEQVSHFHPGQLVVVPWAISCGACRPCARGLTSNCSGTGGTTLLSAYGFGASMGNWGGAVSDLLRVPFADAMLVAVPAGMDPLRLASASDNMPDAWRAVAPALKRQPGASVLIVGGGARSIGLYAAGMAVALGSSRVDYLDHSPERLQIAQSLGANSIQTRPGSGWFARHAPRVHGAFDIAVEASSTAAGLRYALRSLAPGGICTAVGYYFASRTGLPLMQMYANSATLHVGISHPRAVLPQVIALLQNSSFDPLKVTTLIADWDDAPNAFTSDTTKVVVCRKEYRLHRSSMA
jgi:threonine dehydrogenase-like Zn-dependent dehydrogenase